MSQFLFEEEQRFTRLGWIWIVALFPLIFLVIILSADQNLNFEKFSKSFGFAFIAYVPLLAILFISKLQVRINTQQVQYRFFPLLFQWKTVVKEAMATYEITEKKTFYEKVVCGYRRNRFNKSIIMNITGSKFLRITLHDGRKIKIGLENPTGCEWALKRFMNPELI